MKGMCAECEKREFCVELCEKAERFVSSDYIPQTSDMIYKEITNTDKQTEWGVVNLNNTDRQIRTIIHLHLEKKSTREIAYHLSCSQPYIVKIIQKYKAGDNRILKKLQ